MLETTEELMLTATTPSELQLEILHGKKCLVAEDNYQNAQIAIRLLQAQRVAVTHVWNGREAIEAIEQSHYDFILMDLQMPEVNGFETIRLLRSRHNSKSDIPVILFTAEPVTRTDCMLAGFSELLNKPFLPQDFFNILHQVLGNEIPLAEEKVVKHNDKQKKAQTYIDLTYLKTFSNGDELFEQDMITSTVEEIDEGLQSLFAYAQENDTTRVSRMAHTLKSLVAIIGNNELFELFKLINQRTAIATAFITGSSKISCCYGVTQGKPCNLTVSSCCTR